MLMGMHEVLGRDGNLTVWLGHVCLGQISGVGLVVWQCTAP